MSAFGYFLWTIKDKQPAPIESSVIKKTSPSTKSTALPKPPKEKWAYRKELTEKKVEETKSEFDEIEIESRCPPQSESNVILIAGEVLNKPKQDCWTYLKQLKELETVELKKQNEISERIKRKSNNQKDTRLRRDTRPRNWHNISNYRPTKERDTSSMRRQ